MASGWVGTTPPEARELRACGLAALAEAGVLVLPVWLVLTEARGLGLYSGLTDNGAGGLSSSVDRAPRTTLRRNRALPA